MGAIIFSTNGNNKLFLAQKNLRKKDFQAVLSRKWKGYKFNLLE